MAYDISILDKSPIPQGATAAEALEGRRDHLGPPRNASRYASQAETLLDRSSVRGRAP